MSREQFLWVEKYRPQTIADCILPDSIKDTFVALRKKGEMLNMLLSGGAGVGKTTIAKALCEELGCDYIVINGSDQRGIDVVRQMTRSFATTVSMNAGKPKVIIVDEADNLTPDAQKALRAIIEEVASNCRFIFTCNYKARIIEPLHSRCTCIDFTITKADQPAMMAQFMRRLVTILEAEGVEYEKGALVEVIRRHYPDNRRIINELQRYAQITGKVDMGAVASAGGSSKVKTLVEFIRKSDYSQCRQWIAENPDSAVVFSEFYDNISEYVEGVNIPNLILIMGEYQYRAAFVANAELNLAAFVAEVIKNVKFKG